MSEIWLSSQKTLRNRPISSDLPDSISKDSSLIQTAVGKAILPSPGRMSPMTALTADHALTLEERLFDARAACKLKAASYAMHIGPDWRRRLFAQIDSLLDSDEWDPADVPVTETSFTTFIRMLLHLHPKRRPGLGAAANGNIIAAWTNAKNRLTIECGANDNLRWVVVCYDNEERESAAGQTTLSRLIEVLDPYNPKQWLADERG